MDGMITLSVCSPSPTAEFGGWTWPCRKFACYKPPSQSRENLNFSRAADRLHIGQSTLSKQVYELESQLGFRLFDRNHQTVEVTDAGRAFVEEAREAVLHTERAVTAATAVVQWR